MDINNAKSQMRKGMLEYCILLLLKRQAAYASDIIQQLKLCPQINHTLILRRLKEEFPDFEIPTSTFFSARQAW